MTEKWIQTPGGNLQLNKTCKETGKEFFISYQDFIYMRAAAHKGLDECPGDPEVRAKLIKDFKSINERVKMEPETAFMSDGKGHLILKGDHRKEYEVLETYDECVKYFEDNEDKKHWASDEPGSD